jgi:glycosyltransferase involved in cell wall biosynthesis
MHTDLVSVVIPAYNRASSIARAIASALAQTVGPFEIIVVDDASTDETCNVVAALAARDARIRLLRETVNRGGAAARNVGLEAARTEFVAFLDSDDQWLPQHLERRLAVLQAEPKLALVFGSFYVDDGRTREPQHCDPLLGDPLEYLYSARGGFRTSTFAGRRAELLEVRFDDRLRKHQDWDLVLNLVERFGVAADPEPTAVLHVHARDRLSSKLDHESTRSFYVKNSSRGSRTGWVLFCTVMLETTFRTERRSANFRYYLDTLQTIDRRARGVIGILTAALYVPRVGGRLFRVASRNYCLATARARESTAGRSQ